MTLPALLHRIGWSQRELAQRLQCSDQTVYRWNGEPPPGVAAWLQRVAEAIERETPPQRGWGR